MNPRILSLIEQPAPQGFLSTGTSFGQAAIDRAIARAAAKLGDGKSGLVLHADTDGEVSISLVERIGDHIRVEAGAVLDTSQGFRIDKEHLSGRADLVVTF